MSQLQAWTADQHKKSWLPVSITFFRLLRVSDDFLLVKRLAQETNMVCIATIHQPNWEVFTLFDRLTLLAAGRVMYNGPASIFSFPKHIRLSFPDHVDAGDIDQYLTDIGYPSPQHTNPVDQAIAIVNTEFYDIENDITSSAHLDNIASAWITHQSRYNITPDNNQYHTSDIILVKKVSESRDAMRKAIILTQRNFVNYVRNLLGFGIRSKVASSWTLWLVLTLLWC